MSSTASGILIFCFIVVFFGATRIAASATLEARALILRHMLFAIALGLVALAVELVLQARSVPSVTLQRMQEGRVTDDWLTAVRDQGQTHSLVLCGLSLLAVGIAVSAAMVLSDLHGFVMTHRLDLATRDQIAAARSVGPPPADASAAD